MNNNMNKMFGSLISWLLFLFIVIWNLSYANSKIWTSKLAERASFSFDSQDVDASHNSLHNMPRKRRSASSNSDKLKTTEFELLNTNGSYMSFYYTGNGSNAVFVLVTRREAQDPKHGFHHHRKIISSLLYRSKDYGETFTLLTKDLEGSKIVYLYPSKLNNKKVLAISDIKHRYYVTRDEGESWKQYQVPSLSLYYVVFHPTLEDYLLNFNWMTSSLYVSTDFATTWTLLSERVSFHFYWAIPNVDQDNTTVHFEYRNIQGATFYKACKPPYCTDATPDKSLGEIEPLSLVVWNNYIYVQKEDIMDTSNLLVSYKRGMFSEVLLPDGLEADDCEILSMDDDLVVLSATDGKQHNLYISDESGRYFVMSLANIYVVIGPSYHFVDRFEVEGSRGTFIVNQYMPSSQIVTLITFNKGVNWVRIVSPDPSCSMASDCSLHFHLYAKAIAINAGLMVADSDAPGLIFMHGQSGRSLPSAVTRSTDDLWVYMSRDGGVTWTKLFKDLHEIKLLDHGGAIVAMANPRSNSSYSIKYTCTEGLKWETHTFTSKPMHVSIMKTEPGLASLVVNIYGRDKDSHNWRVIKADFGNLLKRKCNDSDYEIWTAKAIYKQGITSNCIVGSTFSFKRRKQNSECFNGMDYDNPVKEVPCKCLYDDYHCSYGYEGSPCKKTSWYKDDLFTRDCQQSYSLPNQYRKIAGDACTGGRLANTPGYVQVPYTKCPVKVPKGLSLDPSAPVVASHSPMTFTLSQRWGSKIGTKYTFDFGDKSTQTVFVGLQAAQNCSHKYHSTGIYHVKVKALNGDGSTFVTCIVTVEDTITHLEVDFPYGIRLNQVTTLHATVTWRPQHPMDMSSVHFVWTFHPEMHSVTAPRLLTWNSTVTHVFNDTGAHHVAVHAINGVSVIYDEFDAYVHEFVKIVKLTFPEFMNHLSPYVWQLWHKSFRRLLEDKLLEITEDDGKRLDIRISRSTTIYGLVTIIGKTKDDPFMAKAAQRIINEVKNPGIVLQYPHSDLQLTIVSATVLSDHHPAPKPKSMVAVMVTVPLVMAALLLFALLFVYYRRRMRSIRRYALLQSNEEEENQLLGASDDDESPLDLNARTGSVNDDQLLDDHVTGIPGNRPALVLMTGTRRSTSRDNTVSV